MIIKDKYGHDKNTELIYAVERGYQYSEDYFGWDYHKKYKTIKGVIQACNYWRKAEWWGSRYKFRIVHVYYDI